jgi:hypothetical protein
MEQHVQLIIVERKIQNQTDKTVETVQPQKTPSIPINYTLRQQQSQSQVIRRIPQMNLQFLR